MPYWVEEKHVTCSFNQYEMPIYIALLRGINVGGQKKIRMSDLRNLATGWGFEQVRTYIQSGNLIFHSDERNGEAIAQTIKQGLLQAYDYEVGLWLAEKKELQKIMDNCPFSEQEIKDQHLYFVLLNSLPSTQLVEELIAEQYENEKFIITDRCVYLLCDQGYGKAKCNNNFFERKLKVEATTRNLKTIQALIELSS